MDHLITLSRYAIGIDVCVCVRTPVCVLICVSVCLTVVCAMYVVLVAIKDETILCRRYGMLPSLSSVSRR